MELLTTLLVAALVIIVVSLRQINQYERGVMFLMGRFTGLKVARVAHCYPCFPEHEESGHACEGS